MKRTIPQSTVITCDGCGVNCTAAHRKCEAGLMVKTHVLDYQGSPCASGDREFDLCDDCAAKVFRVINDKLTELRNEP